MMLQIEPVVLQVFFGCTTVAFTMFVAMKAIIEVNTK